MGVLWVSSNAYNCTCHDATGVMSMASLSWQPNGDGMESTAFVMPPDFGLKGRGKPPPGLERVDDHDSTCTTSVIKRQHA